MQAFIARVTLPATFDDLVDQVQRSGDDTGDMFPMSDIQSLAESDAVSWSVPKHTMVGDVVFFQVSANARDRARKFGPLLDDYELLDDRAFLGVGAAVDYAAEYAGGIMALGRVSARPSPGRGLSPHVSSRSFALVEDLMLVSPPLAVVGHPVWSEWPEFQSHGPVQYRQFASDRRYRRFVTSLGDATGSPIPAWMLNRKVTTGSGTVTRSTWMERARRAESGYATEAGVRQMYADWVLRDLSDGRHLLEEVDAIREGRLAGHPDYVIFVDGIPVPVEAKIRASAEAHLAGQLHRYRTAPILRKSHRDLPLRGHDLVVVVDQTGVYITDSSTTDLPDPALRREDTTPEHIDALRSELKRRVATDT